jgi:hypothetical protein
MTQAPPKPPIIDTVCRLVAGIKATILASCSHKFADEYASAPFEDVHLDPVAIAEWLRQQFKDGKMEGELPVKVGKKYVFGVNGAAQNGPEPVASLSSHREQPGNPLTTVKAMLANGSLRATAAAESVGISYDELKALIDAPGSGLTIARAGWLQEV